MQKGLTILYSPFPDMTEAKKVALILIEEKLLGCVNLIPGVHSFYPWKGQLKEGQEVIFWGKVLPQREAQARRRLEELHSYQVPCVLDLKSQDVNLSYFNWMESLKS